MTTGAKANERDQAVGEMSARSASWLAWSLAGLSMVMFLASTVLYILARSAPVPSSWSADLTLGSLLGGVILLAFPLVGALISSRHPRNPIGWILLADGLLWMFLGMTDYYIVYGLAQRGSVPFALVIAGLNHWLWVPAVGLLGTYLLLLFPDGSLPSRRWYPLAWLSGVVIVLLSIGVMLSPEPLQTIEGIRNPFGLEGQPWIKTAGYAVLPLLPACMLASALSLVLRYRSSRGVERQQIKWIAFAASVVGLLYLTVIISAFVFPSEAWLGAGSPWWLDLLVYAALLSFTTVPMAVGIAILRYHLYDIDLIINRALVYAPLTAMLALFYLGGVVCLQYAFRALSGQESQAAVVASTLGIAALFDPLRRRVQAFVDRFFYRRKYDARKTLDAFSAKLRDETDLDTLRRDDLTGVARETMQPAHVGFWLRPTGALDQVGVEGRER